MFIFGSTDLETPYGSSSQVIIPTLPTYVR